MDNSLNGEFILNSNSTANSEEEHKSKPHHQNEKNPVHFFSSFLRNPDNINFAEQEVGESIVLLLRRHFVTNIPWLALALILTILPPFFPLLFGLFPFPLPSQETISLYLAFYYLVIFGFILINFSLWYFHIGLVTNLRVVDIDLSGILYRHVAEAKHQNIEDVSYKQAGFITSLFNYGDVTVQTAGNEANIEYDRVPHPSKVADIIGDLSQKS